MISQVLFTASLLSVMTGEVRDYRTSSKGPNAVLFAQDSKIVYHEEPPNTPGTMYSLSVYKENTTNTRVPLKWLTMPLEIDKVTNLNFGGSVSVTRSYSVQAEIQNTFKIQAGASIGYECVGFAELSTSITNSTSIGFSAGFTHSTNEINVYGVDMYVDGSEEMPFGVYALDYCCTGATQYYFNYFEHKYTNADLWATYQTTIYKEYNDAHIWLKDTGESYFAYVYYFPTLSEYNAFSNYWRLN